MIPIRNSSFDVSLNISAQNDQSNQFYIKMKSPGQLFYLDNTSYTFEGQVRSYTFEGQVRSYTFEGQVRSYSLRVR